MYLAKGRNNISLQDENIISIIFSRSTSTDWSNFREPCDYFKLLQDLIFKMQIIREVTPLRKFRQKLSHSGKRVAFVPTMGALHEGHLSLLRLAARENDEVIISIYVNPTQFRFDEDFDTYPKTWETDIEAIKRVNHKLASESNCGEISCVFAPTTKTLFPDIPDATAMPEHGSFVSITPLGSMLEGSSRPVFFKGVATVCLKLFNIVKPDYVYLGQKDIQQTVLLRKMVSDFFIDTVIRVGPTIREADGLALSSRNVYLGSRRRKIALVLFETLSIAQRKYLDGERSRDSVLDIALKFARQRSEEQVQLPLHERAMFEIDYISLADPITMEELKTIDEKEGAILSGAIVMKALDKPRSGEDCGTEGGHRPVRLIDNIILEPI